MARGSEAFLAAREDREGRIRAALAERPATVVTLSLNVPGADKNPPGCDTLFSRAACELERALGGAASRLGAGCSPGGEILGPFGVWHASLDPRAVKVAAVTIESRLAGGRLLDVDVYGADGTQVDRARVGLPPRPCFVCPEPAHECARLGRHPLEQLVSSVEALLADAFLHALSDALVSGAREELELTPKPGLVDRLDNGSHPDLTFESMSRSIDLLPAYFAELRGLITAAFVPAPEGAAAGSRIRRRKAAGAITLPACIGAGIRAERRMVDCVGSNAHRGYIFLGGLALLAAGPRPPRHVEEYRARIRELAGQLLGANRGPVRLSHGEALRRAHGLAGIHGEALAGLPAVFEHGLPALRRALDAGRDRARAAHYAMAVLMQHLEDTTAVHRCGLEALTRLREDGRRIQAAVESDDGYRDLLAILNDRYRAARLTMGGVADCLALSLALEGSGVVLPDRDTP